MDDPELEHALAEEAARKSGIAWLRYAGGSGIPAWYAWHDDAFSVVRGGIEQPLPGLESAETVDVVLRAKDDRARLVTVATRPRLLDPQTDEWQTAAKALHGERLNAPDGEAQPRRWAAESQVWRLEPTGDVVEHPGHQPGGSLARPPRRTPATTTDPTPLMVGRTPRPR